MTLRLWRCICSCRRGRWFFFRIGLSSGWIEPTTGLKWPFLAFNWEECSCWSEVFHSISCRGSISPRTWAAPVEKRPGQGFAPNNTSSRHHWRQPLFHQFGTKNRGQGHTANWYRPILPCATTSICLSSAGASHWTLPFWATSAISGADPQIFVFTFWPQPTVHSVSGRRWFWCFFISFWCCL